MKYKILYFIITIAIQSINSKDNNNTNNEINQNSLSYEVSMRIYNKEKEIDFIYLNLTNISKSYLSNIKFSYTGKILYLNEYNKINILKDNNINYRIKWIFMFDSFKELSTYIDLLQKKKTKYYSNVIIITKELFEKISININSFQKSKIFIFYLEDNSFKYIVDKYDYQNTKNEIIYARLLSTNNIEYNIKHLYIILLICLIILIICIYLFRSKLDTDQRNLTFFFVRTVYFFPIIKFSVTFFYVVKLKFLLDYYDLYNIGTTSIITFLNSSLDILYKSLFITFSIIASKGIDETLKIATQLQMLL